MRRETVGVTESLLQAAKEPIRYWRIFTGTRKNFSFCSAIRREQNMKVILTNSRQLRRGITVYLQSSMQRNMRQSMIFSSMYSAEPAGSISTRC